MCKPGEPCNEMDLDQPMGIAGHKDHPFTGTVTRRELLAFRDLQDIKEVQTIIEALWDAYLEESSEVSAYGLRPLTKSAFFQSFITGVAYGQWLLKQPTPEDRAAEEVPVGGDEL